MSEAKSILVVEDEAMIGMMLEDYLDALGYRLHALVATVDEGCEQARQGGFDGALLDCNLQGEKSWPIGMADDLPPAHADRPTLAKPFTMGAVERALGRIVGN